MEELLKKIENGKASAGDITAFIALADKELEILKKTNPEKYFLFAKGLASAMRKLNEEIGELNNLMKTG